MVAALRVLRAAMVAEVASVGVYAGMAALVAAACPLQVTAQDDGLARMGGASLASMRRRG